MTSFYRLLPLIIANALLLLFYLMGRGKMRTEHFPKASAVFVMWIILTALSQLFVYGTPLNAAWARAAVSALLILPAFACLHVCGRDKLREVYSEVNIERQSVELHKQNEERLQKELDYTRAELNELRSKLCK